MRRENEILIDDIVILLEMKSIHTRAPDGLRGVLLAKPQRRGSLLEVEGFRAQPCLFRNT